MGFAVHVLHVVGGAGVLGAIDIPAAGVVGVELEARNAVLGHVDAVGQLQGFLVRAVEVREQGVGQVDTVGFVQIVEVFVADDLLERQAQGVGLVGQGEGQAVGVVVDVAQGLAAGIQGLVVVEVGIQAQGGVVAHVVYGAEVVLVPEVFNVGCVQRGLQALERLVVEAGDAGAIGFNPGCAVFAAELAQARLGSRGHAVKGAGIERQVVELFTVQAHPLKAGRQCAVTDHVDGRAAEVLSAYGQRGVGDAGAEVGQAQLAPLADGVAVAVGQGAVVWPGDVLGVAIQGNGVVSRDLGAEAYGAFGEARLVVEDGALYPVDPARGGFTGAVVVVAETVIATLELVGVPVAGSAAQGLVFDKALGLALSAAGFEFGRHEFIGIGHRSDAADGQGQ